MKKRLMAQPSRTGPFTFRIRERPASSGAVSVMKTTPERLDSSDSSRCVSLQPRQVCNSIPCRLQKHLKKYKNLISDWMTLCWLQNNMSFILCYLYEQQMIGCKILQSCNALGSHHHGIRFVPRSSQLLPASPQHSGFLNSTSRSITMHQLPSM